MIHVHYTRTEAPFILAAVFTLGSVLGQIIGAIRNALFKRGII